MAKKTSQKRTIGKGISKVIFKQMIESTGCLEQATVYTKIMNSKKKDRTFIKHFRVLIMLEK